MPPSGLKNGDRNRDDLAIAAGLGEAVQQDRWWRQANEVHRGVVSEDGE